MSHTVVIPMVRRTSRPPGPRNAGINAFVRRPDGLVRRKGVKTKKLPCPTSERLQTPKLLRMPQLAPKRPQNPQFRFAGSQKIVCTPYANLKTPDNAKLKNFALSGSASSPVRFQNSLVASDWTPRRTIGITTVLGMLKRQVNGLKLPDKSSVCSMLWRHARLAIGKLASTWVFLKPVPRGPESRVHSSYIVTMPRCRHLAASLHQL